MKSRRTLLKKWSFEQADNYITQIYQAIEQLSINPSIGKSIDFIRSNYRSYIVQEYIEFYITISDTQLKVVRVLHQRRDVPSIL